MNSFGPSFDEFATEFASFKIVLGGPGRRSHVRADLGVDRRGRDGNGRSRGKARSLNSKVGRSREEVVIVGRGQVRFGLVSGGPDAHENRVLVEDAGAGKFQVVGFGGLVIVRHWSGEGVWRRVAATEGVLFQREF